MFGIVLKFHDQTLSVVKVITIPVIIQKRSVRYLFIGRSNNIYIYMYIMYMYIYMHRWQPTGWGVFQIPCREWRGDWVIRLSS